MIVDSNFLFELIFEKLGNKIIMIKYSTSTIIWVWNTSVWKIIFHNYENEYLFSHSDTISHEIWYSFDHLIKKATFEKVEIFETW